MWRHLPSFTRILYIKKQDHFFIYLREGPVDFLFQKWRLVLCAFVAVTVGVHESHGHVCCDTEFVHFSFSLRNFFQVFTSTLYVRE